MVIHPDHVIDDMASGCCIFHAMAFKRPCYFYKLNGKDRYRLYLDMHTPEAFMEFKYWTDIFDIINQYKSQAERVILKPRVGIGVDGHVEEAEPGRKVLILRKKYKELGDLFFDESPKSYSVGLGLNISLEQYPYDNQWWQRYLVVSKELYRLKKQRRKMIGDLSKLFRDLV